MIDISECDPRNFSIQKKRGKSILYDYYNIFRNDHDLPMFKYNFMIHNAQIRAIDNDILVISISTKNDKNNKIDNFIMNIIKEVRKKMKCIIDDNIRRTGNMVSITMTMKKMVVYDSNNIVIERESIKPKKVVSIVVKLAGIIMDETNGTIVWKGIQMKMRESVEKKCMFIDDEVQEAVHMERQHKTIPQPPPMPKKKEENVMRPFVPTIDDIMSIKKVLKEVKKNKK